MKKIIIFALIAAMAATAQAQDKVISAKKQAKILKATDAALDRYAPGYNRHYGTPTIEYLDYSMAKKEMSYYFKVYEELMAGINPNSDWDEERYLRFKEDIQWVRKVIDGKTFYIVTYPYDKELEIFMNGYAAQVYVWIDNLDVFQIDLGSGPIISGLDRPKTRGENDRVIQYVPRLVKDLPKAEYYIDENGVEQMRLVYPQK